MKNLPPRTAGKKRQAQSVKLKRKARSKALFTMKDMKIVKFGHLKR
jgi:hypothetical protein